MTFKLGEDELSWRKLVELASVPGPKISVSKKTWAKLTSFREIVERSIESKKVIYGINTGFGFLSDVTIDDSKLVDLQLNLIRSHACGVGDLASPEFVRGLLILRAHTFALGHSAVKRSTIEKVLEFLQHDILPQIPMQGSVGASGDLAPLAHLALGLIGEGKVTYKGHLQEASKALKNAKVKPLIPAAKEGLSLINGTQFMAVVGAFALHHANTLLKSADAAAALSLDAIRGTTLAFDERIQSVRHQPGQKIVANNLRSFYKGKDSIRDSHAKCGKVQDPYSFRCVPQVHGASLDVFKFVEERINGELNSVSDNPLVFSDGSVISGGNFHGQPIAMALDFLAIAVAEIGSISERRIEKLTNPAMSGLPAFVVSEVGLNSGFMIPHVVAASLVSENKILCHPASVDSIPTSADKEDHVSMGPIAARKALKICMHVSDIIAIELLTAAQGIDLLAPLKPGPRLMAVFDGIRTLSKPMRNDRSLYEDIGLVSKWIQNEGLLDIIRRTNPEFK
jgi:histidine ammonia-lyase